MFSWRIVLMISCWLLNSVSGCSVTSEWKPFSFEMLMYRSDLVLIGTDLRHILTSNITDEKESEFRVTCVLKGDNNGINETITIFRVEPVNSCFNSNFEPGNDYIVGLKRQGEGYALQQIHVGQGAAFANDTVYLERALKVCGLQNPRIPNGTDESQSYSFCSNPIPEEPCLAGQGKYVLSHGILLAAFLSSFILMDYFPTLHQI